MAGACKADQKPGDIIMANGTKMNVDRDAAEVARTGRGEARQRLAARPLRPRGEVETRVRR